MNNEDESGGCGFGPWWFVTNTVGLILGVVILGFGWFITFMDASGTDEFDVLNFAFGWTVLGAIFGALLGVAQAIALRQHPRFGTGEKYRLLDAINVIWKWFGFRRHSGFGYNEEGEPVTMGEALRIFPTNTAREFNAVFGGLGGWVGVSIVGMAVGMGVAGALIATNSFGGIILLDPVMIGPLLGASIGIAQWLLLRQKVFQAHWWVIANILGGGAVILGSFVEAGIVVGIFVHGAITAGVMVWLLNQPRQEV
jgi:hypothetical protein